MVKTCNTCFLIKEINLFAKDKTGPDGYRAKCKQCDKMRKHLHYINNKEKYKDACRRFLEKNHDYNKNYYRLKVKA